MGANKNVDLAGFQLLQNFFLLLRRSEAADHLDVTGTPQNAAGSFVVLKGKHVSAPARDLLVVADRLEGRAHSDLRLAIADVAHSSRSWLVISMSRFTSTMAIS